MEEFQLIHPAIYVDLVNLITETQNWKLIVEKLVIKELTPVISSKELDICDDYNM